MKHRSPEQLVYHASIAIEEPDQIVEDVSKINLDNLARQAMYAPENNGQESTENSNQIDSGRDDTSSDSTPSPAELQAKAVVLNCPYCRKKFDRTSTKSMPFCSPRCKQIDLGLWLNEVHSMPYEIDPGIS